MKIRRHAPLTALALATALALSACSGGSDAEETGDGGATGGGESGGVVTVSNGEPQNPLIPTMTNETNGSVAVQNVFAGLVYYDAEGGVHNEVAESIESEDNQTWTITIEDGWTFSDGTPVTADSFARAWDYGAALDNAQNLSYFFEPIQGFSYDENTSLIEAGGLVVEDERTLVVKLNQPESDFPIRLGYAAFFPLPESFYDDPEAFGEAPVGNGPYVLDSWEHDAQITLSPNPDYAGERVAQNGGVELIAYTDEDSAYNDLLAGELDIIKNVPSSAFATFEDDLEGRAVNQPAAVIQTMTVPEWLPEFQGEAGLLRRQAISHAIDREEVTETIFSGSRTPATDFTSPVIDGWTDEIPGNEVLAFDADTAVDLWAQAEAIEPVGADYTLQIASNADSDHQTWVDAVCNNVRAVLDIGCEFYPYPTFDEFLDARDGGTVPGLFRAGWQADYPAMSNFLGPIYGTGAGSNDGQWSNPDFDAKLAEANGAADAEQAVELYKEAETILFENLPGIPLWYSNATGGWADTVDDVEFGWDSDPILYGVTKAA
ncbi:peptide ABC transporter substrate-binding protein [Cellulomonas marina]|uniref:Oligopeptide transport system substrate-binding protein n=1 Tax=Cellulomonas marina TaxID=988821 RepID=A0A1I0Y0Z9_9CELL|nr:ABC transporter substrate-binding protein [Cellulomonas marina]GIG28406.1 ABC transporter substrate-binding protein [Cellulomonas marina]SFB06991.1 oligopeptide transport system substrate-binding protein [Cellulomonas marina]